MFTLLIIDLDHSVEGLVIVHKLKPRMDVTSSKIKLMMICFIYFILFSFKQNKRKNVLHFIFNIRIKIVISSMTPAGKNECCKRSS